MIRRLPVRVKSEEVSKDLQAETPGTLCKPLSLSVDVQGSRALESEGRGEKSVRGGFEVASHPCECFGCLLYVHSILDVS